MRVVVLGVVLVLGACGPTEERCLEANHCVRGGDGMVHCEDGYEWEDPGDEENFTCVALDECSAEKHCVRNILGEKECEEGFYPRPDFEETSTCTRWQILDEIDPLTDRRNITLGINANEPYTNWVGQTVTPALAILCATGESPLLGFFTSTVTANINGVLEVTIRFDSEPPEDVLAIESNSNDFIFFAVEDAQRFAAATVEADERVVLNFQPFEENSVTSVFDVSDLEEATGQWLTDCGL